MGTPLKSISLLTPRGLTPLSPFSNLSPRLLSVTHSGNPNINRSVVKKTPRIRHVAKKLEFSKTSLFDPIQIKITEASELDDVLTRRDVIINTPNKLDIVKNGLQDIKSLNILGKGGFGKVIRGIHQGKFVAVKVIRNNANLRDKNGMHLNHDNIVKILDIVEKERENFFLVIMEYLPECKQLQKVLEDINITVENKVKNFAIDICKGLDYCHRNGVLHLDIKPQNILVCENTCKICDFGNSVKISDVHNFKHQGTVLYTAPELLNGKYPTEECDIYSLGILLWQMRSRSPPYSDIDNIETVIYKVVKCNWRPENNTPNDEYSKLYQTCWSFDPKDRPCISNILKRLVKML